MPLAHGQLDSAAGASSRGNLWFDVTQNGCVAGSTTATINAAWARIYPKVKGKSGAVLYFPANPLPYYWNDPIIPPETEFSILGDGSGATRLQCAAGHCKPLALLGHPLGTGIDADHFVPLAATMDASYGTTRYGIRWRSPSTGKDVIATYPGSAMQIGAGDRWKSTTRGAFSFAVVGYVAGQPAFMPDGACFGMCDVTGKPNPWYFVFAHNGVDNSTIGQAAQSYGANTVVLSAGTSGGLTLVGRQVMILSGTGAGQVRTITAFNYGTLTATLDSNWTTVPDATSRYTVGAPGLQFHFTLADGLLNNTAGLYDPTFGGSQQVLSWSFGAYSGLRRVYVQFDLAATTARNFAQCFLGTGPALSSFTQLADPSGVPSLPLAVAAFQDPSYSPFLINSLGPATDYNFLPGFPSIYQSPAPPMDWQLNGLQLIRGVAGGNVLTVGAPGSSPTLNAAGPCAGATVNDAFHFDNESNANCVFALQMADNATTDPYGGVLSRYAIGRAAANGGYQGVGYVLPLDGNLYGSFCHVRGVSIQTSERWHSCLDVGRAYECTFADAELVFGWWNLGNLPTAANYPHSVRNVRMDLSGDACVSAYESQWWLDDVHFGHPYGAFFRGAGSDVFVTNSYTDLYYGHYAIISHAYGYGGTIVVDRMTVDNEAGYGNVSPDVAFVCVENPNGVGGFGRVSLSNVECTAVGIDGVLVKLRNVGSTRPMRVEVRDVDLQHACRAIVQVDDATNLVGVVEHVHHELGNTTYDNAPALESLDPTGRAAIRHKADELHPPFNGAWVAGAHEVHVAAAPPGLWSKYLVKSSGRFGTATKPVIEGVEQVGVAATSPTSDAIFGVLACPEDYSTITFA